MKLAQRTWTPAATLATLRLRAGMLARARDFFAQRGVLEVTTATVTTTPAVEAHLDPMPVSWLPGETRYLHTSPESQMKRLLAAGSGAIYQFCPVFRQGESGRLHNPEFTMLEWYRPGLGLDGLMGEVIDLFSVWTTLPEPAVMGYSDAFEAVLQLDPVTAPLSRLRDAAPAHDTPDLPDDDRDAWLDWLWACRVLPALDPDIPILIVDYPASQAAFAQIHAGCARRFELFYQGLELCNGYQELTDADQQRHRLATANARREARGLPPLPIDDCLLAALEAGLPDCSGVALGFDRAVMIAGGLTGIDAALPFPADRA